jgi:hypothetical protein
MQAEEGLEVKLDVRSILRDGRAFEPVRGRLFEPLLAGFEDGR